MDNKVAFKTRREWLTPDKKILLIAASHTGNNIFCTPSLRLIKKHHPDIQIDVVALKKQSADVFVSHPDIYKLHTSNSRRFIARICNDYALIFCMNVKSEHMVANLKFAGELIIIPRITRTKLHLADQLLQFTAQWLQCELTPADRAYALGSPTTLPLALFPDAIITPPPSLGLHPPWLRADCHTRLEVLVQASRRAPQALVR